MLRQWHRKLEIAQAASKLSNAPRAAKRVGAALFAKNSLLAIGFNSYGTTHPNAKWSSIHAEHRCLLRRQHYVNSAMTMYVWRETADGKPACSMPCENCITLLKEAGVQKVVYINCTGSIDSRTI